MMYQNARIQPVMAAVRQQVLNWLYSVLTSEYKDVNRTYSDVAQTLSHYSSLSPRTDVYTYENGQSALLLHLSGTIPVNFRGTTYRFPIALWVPHGYPQEAPLVYVTPTEGMLVRPGQHVDPQGKIYHPYLAGWADYWDKSSILGFLELLREIFAKEPPVVSKQQQNALPRTQVAPPPPPVPPLPPGMGRPQSVTSPPSNSSDQPRPPPPPPKPNANPQSSFVAAVPPRRENGLPLPPLPPQQGYDGGRFVAQSPGFQSHTPQRSSSLVYESSHPLPPQSPRQESPVSPITPPQDPYRRASHNQTYEQQPSYTSRPRRDPTQQYLPPGQQPYIPQQTGFQNQQTQQWQWRHYTPQMGPSPQQKPPPPPDLIDAPLELTVPTSSSTNLPAPPIPPNPEKDMLLHNISKALYSQRQHTVAQSISSLPGVSSQHAAMLNALSSMQAELTALESLNQLLTTNTSILHKALHSADTVISSSQHRTPPTVDELLVAPTVVGNQLYELVSEERSLGDALFVLGRAMERGRISPQVFAKMTRSLSREWYLKKALAKKIGFGMGLSTY